MSVSDRNALKLLMKVQKLSFRHGKVQNYNYDDRLAKDEFNNWLCKDPENRRKCRYSGAAKGPKWDELCTF